MFINKVIGNINKLYPRKILQTPDIFLSNIYTVLNSKLSYLNRDSNDYTSTIYALSSGHGKCGVAVVRISGPQAQEALYKMTNIKNLEARKVFLKSIFDPCTHETIDKGLCIWFPGPKSFTGEDSVEFQVHGGTAILNSLFTALSKLGFRQALSGEFTRRAFFNKKLDLAEIEGLADLIHAETEQQRKQALLQADGYLSKLYNQWRQDLLDCLASLEAYVDFSEDDNIEYDTVDRCNKKLKDLRSDICRHSYDGRKGEILRNGARVVILGEPNVGKSSLLNSLAQRNAAIVTPIAGTTRDIVELSIDVSGYPVLLADTAGLTETNNVVEKEGIKRARIYAEQADLIILMISGSELVDSKQYFEDYIRNYIKKLELEDLFIPNENLSKKCCLVVNKIDLIKQNTILQQLKENRIIAISCEKHDLSSLIEFLSEKLNEMCGNPSREHPLISHARHKQHLKQCINHLDEYFNICSMTNYDVVIANQKIRDAMRELEKITGAVSTEEILDIIFKQFCIGK